MIERSPRGLGAVTTPALAALSLAALLGGAPALAAPSQRIQVTQNGDFVLLGNTLGQDCGPGVPAPVRLDFFGDTLESIRAFDVASQRTTGNRKSMTLQAMSEVTLTPETIKILETGTPGAASPAATPCEAGTEQSPAADDTGNRRPKRTRTAPKA